MIDGFVSVTMDGKIVDSNYVFQNMLGYSADELSELTYIDITPEKWWPVEADIVCHQILKRGYSDIYEKEYRRKNGTIFSVELHTVLLRDEKGTPESMWAIVRDITEQQTSGRRILKLNELLEARVLERTASYRQKMPSWSA
jgi:PAS domain S-box-containing protein